MAKLETNASIKKSVTYLLIVMLALIFFSMILMNVWLDNDPTIDSRKFCEQIRERSLSFSQENGRFPTDLEEIDLFDEDVPNLVIFPLTEENFYGFEGGPYCVYKEANSDVKDHIFYDLKKDVLTKRTLR